MGKLINRGFSDDFPDPSYSGIPLYRPALLFFLHGLYPHRTEFVHLEGKIMPSHSFLLENDGTAGIQANQKRHQQHQGTEKDDSHQSTENIHQSLHKSIKRICQGNIPNIDDGQSVQILRNRFGVNNLLIVR